jgi:hypothetical protein
MERRGIQPPCTLEGGPLSPPPEYDVDRAQAARCSRGYCLQKNVHGLERVRSSDLDLKVRDRIAVNVTGQNAIDEVQLACSAGEGGVVDIDEA